LRGRRLPGAALALFLLASAGPAASQEAEERPQIFFEKKVYSDSVGGKRSFYETRIVEKGETLWGILGGGRPLTPERYAERLRDFLRTNPNIKDPSRLVPGQEILVPSAEPGEGAEDGRTVEYLVRKGDSLSRIYVARGAPGKGLKEFLEAVKKINPSVDNVDRIYAGRTLRLPTEAYFGEPLEQVARAERPGPPQAEAPAAPPAAAVPSASPPAEAETPAAPLSGAAASAAAPAAQAAAKPQAELLAPKTPAPDRSFLETGKKEPEGEPVVPPASSPYRGLLSDIFNALGEKWIEKGTMFLPLPSGEELVLLLPDFPLVKFQGGEAALIDFRGGLPPRIRDAIQANWKYIRVVSLEGARGAAGMIDRILRVSGYHSVKEGISRPLVIGDTVSVELPARWVIQRTEESLLSGDLVLLKETPEKPPAALASVLRYAGRVGVRILPFADAPKAMEGFLVGVDEEEKDRGVPVGLVIPAAGGVPAVDFSLTYLGIPPMEGERIRIGGAGGTYQLVLQPERVFKASGKTHVVDTGKMSGAIRTILKDSGYSVFTVGKGESGRSIFERIVKAAGGRVENLKEHLVAGGKDAGYAVRISGSLLSLPGDAAVPGRKVFLVRGKAHSATRALLRDLGVEIVEW
jgi:hypothetical protein